MAGLRPASWWVAGGTSMSLHAYRTRSVLECLRHRSQPVMEWTALLLLLVTQPVFTSSTGERA